MARAIDRLSAKSLPTKGPGFHADGAGLYLRVDPSGARRWVFVFRFRRKRCEMGFGGYPTIPLSSARALARQARAQIQAGMNPIEARRRQRAAIEAVPFGQLADQIVVDLAPQWRNPKVRKGWETTLTVDAATLRPVLVSDITTEDVLAVLKPIWLAKPYTARMLRGRIERVLDAAKARGMRQGENPARWKGHLSLLLPRTKHLSRHHAALPYARMREFFAYLRRGSPSLSAQALDFTILTVARTSETLFATAAEFDLEAKVWTVPAARMKAGRDHRVPLSPAALAIARARIDAVGGSGFLFPGLKRGKPLSNMAMAKVLKGTDFDAFTVHGFRSSFRDWAGDRTSFPRELVEAAMAHLVGDEAEQAYRRGDALDRRRQLMDAWAVYCDQGSSGQIVALMAKAG